MLQGEEAIALHRKAREIATRGRTHVPTRNRATDCLLRCCKKYNDWELLIAVLKEERKFDEAIEEIKKYNEIVAETPERVSGFKSIPLVTVEQLAYEAAKFACDHLASDVTDRLIHFVKLLSGQSLHEFIQFLQQAGNFRAFGLLQKAGKLSLVDTAKLYYRFGKLEEAVSVSEDFKEQRDCEFRAHCKATLFWQRLKNILSSTTPSSTVSESGETSETDKMLRQLFRDLEAFAVECHDNKVPYGEIDANYLLYYLTDTRSYLISAYQLSVQCSNVIGQALSFYRLLSNEPFKSVDIIKVVRTVQSIGDFCDELLRVTSSKSQRATVVRLCERQLRFLGVHFDSQVVDGEEEPSLWFPTAMDTIHLWELPGCPHLKSKSGKREGSVECNRLLTVVGGALIQLACDFLIGERHSTDAKSGRKESANGIAGELDRLVNEAWCPEYMVGIECEHGPHEQLTGKERAAEMVTETAKALDRLITIAKDWPSEDKRHTPVKERMNELRECRKHCVKNMIDLCMPGLHCKLGGAENKAMIRWARRLDQETMRTLGNCTIYQWKKSLTSVDLFNVWRTHRLAGTKSQRQFEDWLQQAQHDHFRNGPRKEKPGDWFQSELSKSLVEFKGRVEYSHGFAFWLWIEFLVDTYRKRDLTSAFKSLCYLVSFELKPAIDASIQQQKADNILMLTEIGVSLALLFMSKRGRPVSIPSPFVAGYMVLDAAISSHERGGQIRMENVVKRISWAQDKEDWARRFLLLAAEHASMSCNTGETVESASLGESRVATSAIVRRLVMVLTLLCNSDSKSELRKRCVAILSGELKDWLLRKAPSSTSLTDEPIQSAREALPCLKEVLLSYNPQQWIYQVDWSPELIFPLRGLKTKDVGHYSQEMERYAVQGSPVKFTEHIPALEELKCLSFPFIISQDLPQFWTIHAPAVRSSIEKRVESSPIRKGFPGKRTAAKSDLPPRLTRPTLLQRYGSSKNTTDSASQGEHAPGADMKAETLAQHTEGTKRYPTPSDSESEFDRESSLGNTSGSNEVRVVAEVKSSRIDAAVGPSQPLDVSRATDKREYSQACIRSKSSAVSMSKARTGDVEKSEHYTSENMPSLESDRELSLEIDGREVHFSKWLEEPPCHIDSKGGEIISSRTDNHVVFPIGAVGKDEAVQITYSQFRLDRLWQGDRCVLDLIQLLPHHVSFHKRVNIYIKHHLKLGESCEILVMRSTIKTDNQRRWDTIAELHYSDLGSIVPAMNDDDSLVCLEDNFIVISSMHFCELCFAVKGLLQLAVQFYQLLPKQPVLNADKFRLYLFLSCRSRQRMKSISEQFPSDCIPDKKGLVYVEVKIDEREPLIIELTFLSIGWKLMGEATNKIRVEYENLENHAQNKHQPQKWDLYYKRTDEQFDPSNKVELQLCFSSKGVSDKSAWVFGSDQSASTQPSSSDPLEESDADRQLTSADIREFYSSVSHKWKAIARFLPLPDGSKYGLKDSEIDKIGDTYKNDDDRCFEALRLWVRNCPESATMVAMVRVLLDTRIGLKEVAATTTVFKAVFEKCESEFAESDGQ